MPEPTPITTSVQLINMALAKLKIEPIRDWDDADFGKRYPERLALATHVTIRDNVLKSYPWRFATQRHASAEETLPTNEWEWDKAFNVPTDTLRVWAVEGQSADESDAWAVVGDQVMTNSLYQSDGAEPPVFTCNMTCIMRKTDVTEYAAEFIDTLVSQLMAEWAYSLTDASTVEERTVEMADEKRRSAQSIDGSQSTPKRVTAYTFIRVR